MSDSWGKQQKSKIDEVFFFKLNVSSAVPLNSETQKVPQRSNYISWITQFGSLFMQKSSLGFSYWIVNL